MTEPTNRENEPHVLEVIMAAGPSLITIWPTLKDADDRSKGMEARREDWIRMRPDMFGVRIRVPRQFTTGTKIYHATAEQLAEAAERAEIVEKTTKVKPAEVKPAEPKADKGNGTEATIEADPPVESAPREIKAAPIA